MKERLDVLLVKKGFYPSREKAKTAIMAGLVFVDGQISDKAGMSINTDCDITVKQDLCPYVSRGGLKLEKAIDLFDIDLKDKVCMDIGASTGGFTDCMLINGASKVYAIDVGYGQLAWKLRSDSRVINIEKCNFRYFDPSHVDEEIDFMSMDVSFISLKLIFPVAAKLLKDGGSILCLVKPQFEAGREQVGKNGIVRDTKVHEEVIEKVISYAQENNLIAKNLTFSPITGAKGNIEYLLHLNKQKNIGYNKPYIDSFNVSEVVQISHAELV